MISANLTLLFLNMAYFVLFWISDWFRIEECRVLRLREIYCRFHIGVRVDCH